MPKSISFQPKLTVFFCTSCNKKYELISGHKEDNVNIDICANCHPFYLGKSVMEANLGPAEKFKHKFNMGKTNINKK